MCLGAVPDASKDAGGLGLSSSKSSNEELAKLLKRLGYPEVVEPNKPSTVLAKALASVCKRAGRLDSISTSFATVEKPSGLVTKPEPH